MIPQLWDDLGQLPKMRLCSLRARLADEHTRLFVLVGPKFAAGDAERPTSVAVNQKHEPSYHFGTLPRRMVFRAKNARSPHAELL
jgi:hypothetical protein